MERRFVSASRLTLRCVAAVAAIGGSQLTTYGAIPDVARGRLAQWELLMRALRELI